MVKEVSDEIDRAGGLVTIETALAVIVKHRGLCGSGAEPVGCIGVRVTIGRHNKTRFMRR